MAMKLTTHQQEMLDGKHGEAKKFGMDKLVDFGEAVDAKEMVDLVLVLNCCPIYSKDRQNPETKKKLEMYDLGHGPLYDPIFAMKDAHVADETGTQAGNDPYLVQFDKVEEKGYPWNFELPGKGSFKIDPEMVADLKAGRDKLAEHGWLNWFSCQPQVNTCIPKMESTAPAQNRAARPTSTPSSAPAPIGNPPSTRSMPPTPAACRNTAPTSTRIGRPNASLSLMTRPGTTSSAPGTGRPWAPPSPTRRRTGFQPCSICPSKLGPTAAKQIVSACSPGMNDPIMHLMGYTPESPTLEAAFKGKMPKNPERFKITMDDIVEMYRHINAIAPAPGPERAKPVDIVIFGCPVATFEEVREVARLLKGKKVKEGVMLWVQTDTPNYHMAHHYGDAKIIEDAGGKIYHQTCMAMNPSGTTRRASPSPLTASST